MLDYHNGRDLVHTPTPLNLITDACGAFELYLSQRKHYKNPPIKCALKHSRATFEWIPIGSPIFGYTGFQISFQFATAWFIKCLSTHKSKYGNPISRDRPLGWLPARVLDIWPSHETKLRSVENNGITGSYACLSHCWGLYQLLKTTRNPETLSRFKNRIS